MHGGAAAPPRGAARRRRRRAAPGPVLASALLAALLATLVAVQPAGAQSASQLQYQITNLGNQIAGLRAQLNDLERVVHTGAAPRNAAPEAEAMPDDGIGERNSRRLAELETDIDEAREWRRRVTGRFEELENMLRRVEDRIERLVADVDFRLAALEQGQQQAQDGAVVAPAGEDPAGAQPAADDQAGIAPGQGEGYEPSAAPRTLGTVPADGAPAEAPPPGQTPREQYDAAFALLESARYEEAHAALTGFIDANPSDPLVENATYWRAESLYARKMYADAAKSYALNLRQYPEGRKAPDNMVKLGMALLKLGRTEEACRTFTQLDQTFPDPPLRIRRAAQQGRQQADCP